MKLFVVKCFILFFLLVVIDIAFGSLFDYALEKATLTDFGRDNHICNIGNEDLLVFGSSRAIHHYNTQMIEDSLGLDSYNCGEDGQGIILHYGRLLMELERHSPKVIIYDFQPDYDLELNDNTKYLKWLKPHYNRSGISNIIWSIDKTECLKSTSHLYRYNSDYILLLIALTHLNEHPDSDGFFPLEGEMDITKIDEEKKLYENDILLDPIKILYLKRFIEKIKGVKVFFIVSPTWYGNRIKGKSTLFRLLYKQDNLFFYDFSSDAKYVHKNNYFKDGMHLNSQGADEFTKDLIKLMKKN